MLHDMSGGDTIVAVATPPGKGGIAIVKISGAASISIASQLYSGKENLSDANRRMCYGRVTDGEYTIDEALFCVMRSPKSYTGEDIVEIQCHGGYASANEILSRLIDRGARMAGPGEFTRRAFENGKIDLIQAESVMEIVAAQGYEHLRRAEQLMDGRFSHRIESLLDNIRKCLSILEVSIDFHHDEPDPEQKNQMRETVATTIQTLDTMITSYSAGKRLKDGLNVVISGEVNVGKSSLFNALLGRKRAITNKQPGTTRDWIEENIDLDGIAVNLIDTAGLRDTDDEIEREGVRETERIVTTSDIVLSLKSAVPGEPLPSFPTASDDNNNRICIISKSDLITDQLPLPGIILVSSKNGKGLDTVSRTIADMAKELVTTRSDDAPVMIERHRRELTKARDALRRSLSSIDSWTEEITSLELYDAKSHIESLLGRNIDLHILDDIFSNFCIGK